MENSNNEYMKSAHLVDIANNAVYCLAFERTIDDSSIFYYELCHPRSGLYRSFTSVEDL
jgi:hypothetical protein